MRAGQAGRQAAVISVLVAVATVRESFRSGLWLFIGGGPFENPAALAGLYSGNPGPAGPISHKILFYWIFL
jgi:hypothetical protein